ncbi:MAG: LPS-assembly protein LptD [Dysgonamonadaceae bacterium]|jgi:hypothetical protein|nr:LPS-assembly protein LptD [Dysgonamonadaceae bacterium]
MAVKIYSLLITLVSSSLFICQNTWTQDILPDSFLQEMKMAADSTLIESDSIPANVAPDSVPVNPNAIDAPILYASKDSMIMVLKDQNMIYMYGDGSVQYKNLDLKGEYIEIDADNKILLSTFGLDSVGNEFGYPVFKEGETEYEMKKARYNFKTKKMFITDVITQQGEGYVTAFETKKMPNDDLYMRNGRYTTCDDHEHPHFYLQLTKAKVRPGKTIVTGPAYLVIEDVPLPVAIPFGFFPFTSDYSSGIIMPTYGDEMQRGFSLREGGYYFAFNDYVDLALTGEIYTNLSFGVNARSNYRKRYKFSGGLQASYLVTIMGNKGDMDYSKSNSFRLAWNHSQDAKANPFGTFSASVNLTTQSYDRNELNSLYSNQYTQNTKSSSINYNYRFPDSPFSFSINSTINQISKDTTLSVTLPNFTINMKEVYPFRRKEQIGAPKWYEKISITYNGTISNSINNVKEHDFFKKNLIKDWKNGVKHAIPISASFSLFKNITISPSVTYNERWYFNKIDRQYDYKTHRDVPADTTYGFYRIYDYSGSVSAQTKLYGMYKFWNVFGEWTKKTVIRHVITPKVSFSGSPDFSDEKYHYYKNLIYLNDQTGQLDTINYSPYSHHLWGGVPGKGKTGSLRLDLDNNLEMKLPIAGTDSTRKYTLIDNFHAGMTYNFLATDFKWSDLSTSIRFKLGKYTLNLSGIFDTYTYNETGKRMNVPRWEAGKGIGRLKSTGYSFSYSLNNEAIKKWYENLHGFFFGKKEEDNTAENNPSNINPEQPDADTDENNEDNPTRNPLRKSQKSDDNYDEDGYLLNKIQWNLNFNYSWNLGYGEFKPEIREYGYRKNQSFGASGNISPTKGWSFNFSTNYDFDSKKFTTMQCSISRQMHCWSMSASFIPVGPYKSYNFSIAVNSSMLKDLKYTQSSSFRDAMNWGN